MTRPNAIRAAIWAGKWIGYREESMRAARAARGADRARLVARARLDNHNAVSALCMARYYHLIEINSALTERSKYAV
jgi:hypothetical protein